MEFYFSFPNHLDNAENTTELISLFEDPPISFQRVLRTVHYVEVRASALKRGGGFDNVDLLNLLCQRCTEYGIAVSVRSGVLGRTISGRNPDGFNNDLSFMERLNERIGGMVLLAESLLSGVGDEDRETGEFSKGSDPAKRAQCFVEAASSFSDRFGYTPKCIAGDTSLPKWRDSVHYNFLEDTAIVFDAFAQAGITTLHGFLEAMNDAEMNTDQLASAVEHFRKAGFVLGVTPINDADTPKEYRRRLLAQAKTLKSFGVTMLGISSWDRREGVPTLRDHIKNAVELIELTA